MKLAHSLYNAALMSIFIRRKPLGRRFHAVYWKACCGKSNLPGSAEVLTKTETLKQTNQNSNQKEQRQNRGRII